MSQNERTNKTMKQLTLIIAVLVSASASAMAWEYNDIVDEMGRDAPEHQARVFSTKQDAKPTLSKSATQEGIKEGVAFRVSNGTERDEKPTNIHRFGVYVSPRDGHWVQSKTDDGSIVTLEDGSVWQIDPLDQIDTTLWLPMTEITVVETGSGYLLINTDDGEKAHARLLHQ
jgi:hypothetical protein